MLPDALAPLAAYRRFVTYRLEPDPDRPGKTMKFPTDWRTGWKCDAHDPEKQCTYAEAAATGRPVGFVIQPEDGFFFLDIDGAWQGTDWSPLAHDLCRRLAGAAVEVSQSGTGLHIIGRGFVPDHSCKNIPLHLELYTERRFVALTGTGASGNVMFDVGPAIAQIAADYFPPNPHGEVAGWTDTPVPGWGGPEDDADLIRALCASGKKSAGAAFGTGHVLPVDLWTANADALAAKWPSDKGGYDASQADAALAAHLAYWTGKNCERIRGLMLQSDLARPKWEDRPEWLELTIMNACAVVTNVCPPKPAVAPLGADGAPAPTPAAPSIALRTSGREFLGVTDQLQFFAGCVYVVDENKVWVPRTGDRLDKARFDVVYGGHAFPIDNENEKVVDSAYDAFTRSRAFAAPCVDRACFRPEHPAGAIIQEEGRAFVNTYIPVQPPTLDGDPGPFLRHLEKLFPIARDRDILCHYMASVVRNPGLKAQWWPLIQGAEGNGKSLLNRLMAFCVGLRYSHLVNPEAMAKTGNQFNSWVQGNLYLGIEEIYVNNRRDFLETFKTTVTDDRIATEGKGRDQGVGDNRLNGMMFTNHPDAIPITVDSRRYCILYTAQQSADDIVAHGMGGAYFPDLYDWFYGRGAYADRGGMYGARIINGWLRSYPLTAELDPAQLCVRAPATSSTALALRLSLGRAEQEILEAIDEGRPGFAGGWISSIALDRLLDTLRAAVPRTKRREMLKGLGYDYHPALADGRVNSVVAPDHGKPRLYVKDGHLAQNLTEPAMIAKAYTAAQGSDAATQKAFG